MLRTSACSRRGPAPPGAPQKFGVRGRLRPEPAGRCCPCRARPPRPPQPRASRAGGAPSAREAAFAAGGCGGRARVGNREKGRDSERRRQKAAHEGRGGGRRAPASVPGPGVRPAAGAPPAPPPAPHRPRSRGAPASGPRPPPGRSCPLLALRTMSQVWGSAQRVGTPTYTRREGLAPRPPRPAALRHLPRGGLGARCSPAASAESADSGFPGCGRRECAPPAVGGASGTPVAAPRGAGRGPGSRSDARRAPGLQPRSRAPRGACGPGRLSRSPWGGQRLLPQTPQSFPGGGSKGREVRGAALRLRLGSSHAEGPGPVLLLGTSTFRAAGGAAPRRGMQGPPRPLLASCTRSRLQ